MRTLLVTLLLALAAPAPGAASVATQAPGSGGPRRLLVIDLDDVGFDLLRDAPTPTLDWIEARGRFFTSFTTSPLCSPTRAMMNLGAYPSHPDVLLGQVVSPSATYALPNAPLEPLASIVAAAGFTTAKVGKWHLAPRNDARHPHTLGWQFYAGSLGNVQSPNWGYTAFTWTVNGVTTFTVGHYLTTLETDVALELVRGGTSLVSLSYHAPHKPWHEPPAHLHSVSPIVTNRDRARAMLEACDRELGRLVREALPLGYTVIVFADNGTAQPIGGQKGTLYDGGVVVPCWAIGPGVAPGVDDSRVGAVDLYATVAEYFGVATGPPHRGPHSASFLPALRGAPDERRWTYSERFTGMGLDPRTSGVLWRRTVRGARYKLMQHPDATGEVLVDLWTDPGETVDLLARPLDAAALAALALFRDVLGRL